MKTIIWLSFVSSLSPHSIRHKFFYSDRIINGYDVEPAFRYPWMVAIFRYNTYWCGGVLLSEKVVLTAAHCVGGDGSLKSFKVHLHRHDLDKEASEESGKVFQVADRISHPDYQDGTFHNDIAIFILNTTGNARTNMQLDDAPKHKDRMEVTALGWGRTQITGGNHPILQELKLPTYNDDACIEDYANQPKPYIIKPEIQLCAGFVEGGKDACGGDSGGPLFTYIRDKPVLIGIVTNGGTCAASHSPGIYARINYYRKWILGIMDAVS